MSVIFDMLIVFPSLILWSLVFHELGHFLYMRNRIKKSVTIRFWENSKFRFKLATGVIEDYRDLSEKQTLRLYLWGIVAGFIPLLFAGLIINILPFVAAFVCYLRGCGKDLFNIFFILRRLKHEVKKG